MAASASNNDLRKKVDQKLAKSQDKQAFNEKLETIQKNIQDIVLTAPEPIKLNSFWGQYSRRYTGLPNSQDFGLTKRHHLLSITKICTVYTGQDGEQYVTALQSQERNKYLKKETSDQSSSGEKQRGIRAKESGQGATPGKSSKNPDEGSNPVGHQKRKPKSKQVDTQGGASKQANSHERSSTQANSRERSLTQENSRERSSTQANSRERSSTQANSRERSSTQANSRERSSTQANSRERSSERTEMAYQNPYFGNQRDQHYPPMGFQPPPQRQQQQHMFNAAPMYQQPHASHNQPQNYGYRQGGYFNQGRGAQQQRQTIQEPKNLEMKHVPKADVNVIAEDCIDRLLDAKEYVSPERVEKLVLTHYKVESLHQLGIRYLEHLPCVNNLIRTQSRVNAYIQGFIRVRAIASLHELQENLKDYTDDKQSFEQLRVGPLAKQPLVYEYFKFPGDTEIPELTTSDILDQLRNYMTENNLWSGKIEMEGFMSYLMTQFQVESPFALGVKIKSLPLAAGVLKKSQRDASLANQAVFKTYSASTEQNVAAAFRNFKSGIMAEEAGLCTMRKDLMKMSAARVVEQVFSKLHVLQSSIAYTSGALLQHREMKALQKGTEMTKGFSKLIQNDPLYRNLFQMAVCCSWEEVHKSLQFIIGYEDNGTSGQQPQAGPSAAGAGKNAPRPRIGDVVSKVLLYLERCLVRGSLTLLHLARIENKLLEDYADFQSFLEISNKTFLDFVTGNDEVKHYLEENGGATLGTAGGATGACAGYQAALTDLHDFILQAALHDSAQVADLERALCWHYRVSDVKQLGHGSAASLLAGTTKNPRLNKQQHVCYEVALCAKESQSALGTNTSKVGLMGHQVRESAAVCLHNCPLLTDMAEWSHWDLIFKPELGDLKDFIRKNGGIHSITLPGTNRSVITKIVAVESKPGTLLKLTADTTNDMFANAATSGDVVSTCGHLASLVAANKGIQHTPLALLGNHLKTGLLKIQAATTCEEEVTGDDAGSVAVGRFVLECLTTLPFVTCQAVASQVFIEPLSDVVGQTKSRELLPRCARTDGEHSRLQVLGLLLGIDNWSATFQQRLEPPAPTLAAKIASVTASAREPEMIELSSDEDDSDDEESDFLNTSDESDSEEKPTTKEPEVIELSSQDDEEAMLIDSDSEETSITEITNSESKSDVVPEVMPEVKTELGANGDGPSETTVPPGLDEASRACWEVIEDIRRSEFGINVTLSSEGQKLMIKQQERLGRSLDRLSNDLYSKDTHFVLELIQNADDNKYPTEGSVVPSIKFIVESERITVLNNEQGFEERNIRAICDVGKSTKGKHKAGYIGQKGIGFKSVFRVTDCPEIHSNSYQFRFDLSTGPQGYILPHWVDKRPDQSERWMTQIMLPLKGDVVNSSKLRQLAARFQDVHPSLLLFLHRLRSITVINKIGDYKAKMERRDVGNGIIEIRHMMGSDRQTTKTDRWLVAKKVLDASHISSQAKSGVEVESTEIALAFPLHEVDDSQALAPKQPVFAFLPLRSYGFRFVIQGDFDVPSSREDVDRDSMWNQWLQSEIHVLFVEALKTFKDQRNLSQVEAVCLFMKFIPLEDEILDFFRPVATQILQRLRSEPCLPADAAPGTAPEWRLPSQLILATDSLLRDIATPQLLQNQLGLSYLHHDVATRINPSMLSGLGVQVLNTAHLIEIGRALAITLSQAAVTEKPQWIKRLAKWFAAVFRSLDEFNVDKAVLAQIEALPIIPLSNGEITCLKDNAIFFPLGAEEMDQDDESQDLVAFLEKDLNTVDAALLTPLDEVSRPQAWRLLEMLGVRRLQPSDIINHHILPALRAPNIMTKPAGLLTAYFVYIKEELDRQPNLVSMGDLKDVAIILTNQGMKRPGKDQIHFTPAFGNKLHLEKELPGYDWLLVDPVYLVRTKTNLDVQTWHGFLTALGVQDLIAITQETVTVSREDISQSAWSEYARELPTTEHEFVLEDCDCPQFLELVTNNSHPQTFHRQMQVLFDIFDSYWETHFTKCTTTHLKTGSGQALRQVETTFGMMVKRLKWVPAVEVLSTSDTLGRTVSEKKPSERIGHELYLSSMGVERLLAHHVPYLQSFNTPRSTLCELLGVHTALTPGHVLELLVRWGSRTAIDTPRMLLTSLAHIKAVYTFLHERLPPKDMQDLFHNHPVLFEPKTDISVMPDDPQAVIEGEMMARSEVRWNDPTNLFAKYNETLLDQGKARMVKANMSVWYRDLEDLMFRSARLAERPTLLEYADLIIAISTSCTVQQALTDLLQLFSMIGEEIEHQSQNAGPFLESVKPVITKLKTLAIFPTKGNKWLHLSDHPLIADDKQTERLFNKKEGVNFLATDDKFNVLANRRKDRRGGPPYKSEYVLAFYEACGASTVSEVLVTKYVPESFQLCTPVHRYTASMLPFIQNLLCVEYPEVYDAHQERNIGERLANMKFIQVSKLDVVYHLKPLPEVIVKLSEVCKWKDDEDEFNFYVHKDSTMATNELNKELARYFSRGNDICMKEIKALLFDLMPLVRDATPQLEEFMQDRDISRLPADEKPWELPPPPVVKPPPPPPPPPQPARSETPEEGSRPPTPSGERPEGMMSWPPRSNPTAVPQAHGGPPSGPRSTQWPPPAPPTRPDYSQVPQGLRASRQSDMSSVDGDRASVMSDSASVSSMSHRSMSGDYTSHAGDQVTSEHRSEAGSMSGERSGLSGQYGHHGAGHQGGSHSGPGAPGHHQHPGGSGGGPPSQGHSTQRARSPEPLPPGVEEADMEVTPSTPTDTQAADVRTHEGSPEFKSPAPPGTPSHTPGHTPRLGQKRVRLESGASIGSIGDRDQQLWFDVPMWGGDQAVEETLEELPCRSKLPEDMNLTDGAGDELLVGRWGENLVYNYLLSLKDDPNSQVFYVKWVNEERESSFPYDCEVHYYDPETETTRRVFIEVKATRSDKKAFFPISGAEVKCAFERAEDYHLYRVFNAGNQQTVRLTKLENLAAKIEEKLVRLCLVI